MHAKVKFLLAGLVGFLMQLPTPALAQWSIGSDENRLRGKAIVDVGTVTEESRMVERYDPLLERETLETVQWREFRGRQRRCMEPGIGLVGYSTAALLLADGQHGIYVATIESSVGSIDIGVEQVLLRECPSF